MERGGEEHEAAIERIKNAAKANGKVAAMFCEFIRLGHKYPETQLLRPQPRPLQLDQFLDPRATEANRTFHQVRTANKPSLALTKASP